MLLKRGGDLRINSINKNGELYNFNWRFKKHRIKGIIYENLTVNFKIMCRIDKKENITIGLQTGHYKQIKLERRSDVEDVINLDLYKLDPNAKYLELTLDEIKKILCRRIDDDKTANFPYGQQVYIHIINIINDKIQTEYYYPIFIYNQFYGYSEIENNKSNNYGFNNIPVNLNEYKGPTFINQETLSLTKYGDNGVLVSLFPIDISADLEIYELNQLKTLKIPIFGERKDTTYYFFTDELVHSPDDLTQGSNPYPYKKVDPHKIIELVNNQEEVKSINKKLDFGIDCPFGVTTFTNKIESFSDYKIMKDLFTNFNTKFNNYLVTNNNELQVLNKHLFNIIKCQTLLIAKQLKIYYDKLTLNVYTPKDDDIYKYIVVPYLNDGNEIILFHRMRRAINFNEKGVNISYTNNIRTTILKEFIHQTSIMNDTNATDAEYLYIKINDYNLSCYFSGEFNNNGTITLCYENINKIDNLETINNILSKEVIICVPTNKINNLNTMGLDYIKICNNYLIGYSYGDFRYHHCVKKTSSQII